MRSLLLAFDWLKNLLTFFTQRLSRWLKGNKIARREKEREREKEEEIGRSEAEKRKPANEQTGLIACYVFREEKRKKKKIAKLWLLGSLESPFVLSHLLWLTKLEEDSSATALAAALSQIHFHSDFFNSSLEDYENVFAIKMFDFALAGLQ